MIILIHKINQTMSRHEVQIVCENALQLIVRRGAQMARDNRTIKNNLPNYTNCAQSKVTDNMVIQAGASSQNNRHNINPQKQPSNLAKDHHSFLSVVTIPLKTSQDKSNLNDVTQRTTNQTSPRISKRSSIQANRKSAIRTKEIINSKFIDLSGIHFDSDGNKGKILTQAMKKQQMEIETLRHNRLHQDKITQQRNQLINRNREQKNHRVQQLRHKMHRHLSEKTHKVTYDADGSMLFVSDETQQKALTRKYPPSNTIFKFQVQKDPINQQHHGPTHIKQRAAKGQLFASSVLKTVNLSKFSLNMTSKTCNLDEFAFMKRNDLFNNNHCRQVTTIPFLQISQGTNYTQSNTNQSVSKKKTQRTAHSENKGKFKIHSQLEIANDNSQMHNTKTEVIQIGKQRKQLDRRRIQSSRPYARPKTGNIKTVRTSDRITSVNEQLMFELIE